MGENNKYNSLVIESLFLKAFNYILLILAVVIIITPILILVIIAFKSNEEYALTGIWELPKSFLYFDNFKDAFTGAHMLVGFKNTFILIAVSLPGSLLMASMAAYALSRFDLKYKNLILSAFLIALVIPTTTTLIAVFHVIKAINAYNTIFAGIVLYLSAGVVDLYIFIQFMDKIPKALDESAMIDGASHFKIYSSIIIPQLKPAIATVSILKILGIYNDFFIPTTFMTKTSLLTLSTGLYRFVSDRYQRWNVISAGILLVLIPTIIIYLFAQKNIISGVTEGSVKG